jgi:hypothetical protein
VLLTYILTQSPSFALDFAKLSLFLERTLHNNT